MLDPDLLQKMRDAVDGMMNHLRTYDLDDGECMVVLSSMFSVCACAAGLSPSDAIRGLSDLEAWAAAQRYAAMRMRGR